MVDFHHNKSSVTMPFTSNKLGAFKPTPTSLTPAKAPRCIRFHLSDGTSLDAPSRIFIMLGRTDEDSDPRNPIDVDFGSAGGLEEGVSHEHAVVQVMRNQVLIKDFNSTNGTALNGKSLYSMQEYPVSDGDEITLGHLTMQVSFIY